MDAFTTGSIVAALWTGEFDDVSIDELPAETLVQFVEDAAKFQADNRTLLDYARDRLGAIDEYLGHDFWLTRNHHGAGFWDRGHGELGKRLTEAAHKFPEVDLVRGDDGLLYLEGN